MAGWLRLLSRNPLTPPTRTAPPHWWGGSFYFHDYFRRHSPPRLTPCPVSPSHALASPRLRPSHALRLPCPTRPALPNFLPRETLTIPHTPHTPHTPCPALPSLPALFPSNAIGNALQRSRTLYKALHAPFGTLAPLVPVEALSVALSALRGEPSRRTRHATPPRHATTHTPTTHSGRPR